MKGGDGVNPQLTCIDVNDPLSGSADNTFLCRTPPSPSPSASSSSLLAAGMWFRLRSSAALAAWWRAMGSPPPTASATLRVWPDMIFAAVVGAAAAAEEEEEDMPRNAGELWLIEGRCCWCGLLLVICCCCCSPPPTDAKTNSPNLNKWYKILTQKKKQTSPFLHTKS